MGVKLRKRLILTIFQVEHGSTDPGSTTLRFEKFKIWKFNNTSFRKIQNLEIKIIRVLKLPRVLPRTGIA